MAGTRHLANTKEQGMKLGLQTVCAADLEIDGVVALAKAQGLLQAIAAVRAAVTEVP